MIDKDRRGAKLGEVASNRQRKRWDAAGENTRAEHGDECQLKWERERNKRGGERVEV